MAGELTSREVEEVVDSYVESEEDSKVELTKLVAQYHREAGALTREIARLKADHGVDHSVALEKMRTDNAEAIQTVQARASERVDAAQERVKVAEREKDAALTVAESIIEETQTVSDEFKQAHAKELHAQGKTIARMKGEIRELKKKIGLWEKLGLLVANAPADILVDEKDPIWEEIEKMGKLLDEGPNPSPGENPAVDDSLPLPGENEETNDRQTE